MNLTTPIPRWRRERSLYTPPVLVKTRSNCAEFDTEHFSPICHEQCLTTKRERSISPRISLLLLPSGPSTVVRLVVPIVINAIQRTAVWFSTHVFSKILERFPTFTDSDASSAIAEEHLVAAPSATITHRTPRFVARMRSIFHRKKPQPYGDWLVRHCLTGSTGRLTIRIAMVPTIVRFPAGGRLDRKEGRYSAPFSF